MRPPHDSPDIRLHARSLSPAHPPSPSHQRTAVDWQALYEAMLEHVTSHAEIWLRGAMADILSHAEDPRRGSTATVAARAAAAGAAVRKVIPAWLEPFKDPANVRFTRTPDHILLREKESASEPAPVVDEPEPEPPPVERRVFVPAPGVRYARTPDRLLTKVEAPVADGAVPVDPSAADLPLTVLIEESLVLAQAAEAVETAAPEPEEGAGFEDVAWSDVAPQPWGAVLQLGPLEATPQVPEQDNAPALPWSVVAAEPAPLAADEPPALDEPEPCAVHPEEEEPEEDGSDIVLGEADAAVREEVAATADAAARLETALSRAVVGPKPVRRQRLSGAYEAPPLELLSEPSRQTGVTLSRDALEQHARLLEGVLEDFGVRGEIINVRPGPVVTLYELEPAPGIKSSRVVGLADDIARSMSAISARVAVVQGRNAIGIELPNQRRDTVFLRELLATEAFAAARHKLAIALGKTIGGEPVIVDLARMPHLLVAGTTGSGKSVAINTMILSLLYRLKPEECRLIMVDPKMLELSIYDGIPHLLTPVVTDPKKAVIALKWAVREMEDRYKKMSKVGVRNIDGFNARVAEAAAKGEVITRTVQTGYDRQTGEAVYEQEAMDLTVLPYIVVIVDEMADLMMVAGKDIEGAIQRLAQMARAAGIHLIMATQRPSVDVITGTIKANFPTRISFQVTSKIDSRTILGEQGAEQLLGQGDMLYMAGGGRIGRVHGPFVSDAEVEAVVAHLKTQGQPDYLDVTTEEGDPGQEPAAEGEAGEDAAVFDRTAMGAGAAPDDNDLYDQAVKIVLRDKKCSTSYIQRRLSVGYNKAASLVEKMEKEGIVGAANHAGKREILIYSRDVRAITITMPEEEEDGA